MEQSGEVVIARNGVRVIRLVREQPEHARPLAWPDAGAANAVPPIHKDPTDRMLIAQALRRRMPVITDDGLFASYGGTLVW